MCNTLSRSIYIVYAFLCNKVIQFNTRDILSLSTIILTWYQSSGMEIRADKARSRQGSPCSPEAFCKSLFSHIFAKNSFVTRTLVVALYSKKASPSLTSSRIGSAPVFPRAYLSLFYKAVVLLEQSSTQICGL